MCLVLGARPTTKDVGAFLHPASEVREAARRIDVGTDWLNDTVTGYLSERGEFHACPDLPHLRVLTAAPEHLPAMKCMAMRMGSEFHDIDDARSLLRCLNLTELDAAPDIISRHDPDERIPQKTIHVLGDMFAMDTPEHRNRAEGPSR